MLFAASALLHRLSSVCCLACLSAYSAVVCRSVHDLVRAETFSFPEALINSTHVKDISVLGVGDAKEGVAPRHPGPLKPSTPDSAATHGGILVSPTATPELEGDLGYIPKRGCGARSRDSEPRLDPASYEACSKTQMHSVSDRAGGKWRVYRHKPGYLINTLSIDSVAATHMQASDQSLGSETTQLWRAAVSDCDDTSRVAHYIGSKGEAIKQDDTARPTSTPTTRSDGRYAPPTPDPTAISCSSLLRATAGYSEWTPVPLQRARTSEIGVNLR